VWGTLRAASLAAVVALAGCGPVSNAPCVLHAFIRPEAITIPAALPGASAVDLYAFPSPNTPANVVLAFNLHPLIPPGFGAFTVFDPNNIYEIKIDNTGDFVEDLEIQLKATGTGLNQQIQISGPSKPSKPGNLSVFNQPDPVVGMINTPFTLSNGAMIFAGAREDPFFFDANAFYSMLPDRANLLGPTFGNINGMSVSTTPAKPNQLQLTSFRSASQAQDFFKGSSLLSIVVELHRSLLGTGKINIWATASRGTCISSQVSRQGRPLVTTVFPTVANNRQQDNNIDNPTDDVNSLAKDIQAFMTGAAGRSQAVTNAVVKIFSPDVLTLDLSSSAAASYLAIELGSPSAHAFGGRALTDDVVDTLFGIAFGNTLPRLGLVADDGREIPLMTTDNVGAGGKHFQATFPYLGPPQ
jgi:hypothetical protein